MAKHCVVIGAGIVGSSCAWHLQRKGRQVTLIDHKFPGQSCSFGNASCLATSSVIPFSYPGMIKKVPGWLLDPLGPMCIRPLDFPALIPWFWKFWRSSNMQVVEEVAKAQTQLMQFVSADYDEILQATNSCHLKHAKGAIHIFDTEKEYQQEQWQTELRARLGFSSHRLSSAEVESLLPDLNLGQGVAVMMPDWQHLTDPAKVTSQIAEHGFNNGVTWIHDKVHAVSAAETGVSVTTESGRQVEADELVVAAGAWSNSLAGQLDYQLPLIAKRGYHSMISQPGIKLDYPVMSISRGFVMTPLDNGLRVAGTAEFAALDAKPDYRRAQVLLKQASRYLKGLRTEGATEWLGHRPMMADSNPVISTSPRHRNVFYAFGHGHYGLTQGPTTGRVIADMVAGDQASVDLMPFRFDRFL